MDGQPYPTEEVVRACGHRMTYILCGDDQDEARRQRWQASLCPVCARLLGRPRRTPRLAPRPAHKTSL